MKGRLAALRAEKQVEIDDNPVHPPAKNEEAARSFDQASFLAKVAELTPTVSNLCRADEAEKQAQLTRCVG